MATTCLQISEPTGELARRLERGLEAAHVTVVWQPVEGAAVLHVTSHSGRHTLSIGPDGKALEYEVYYTVEFDVRKAGSDFEIPQQQITLTRDFLFDPLEALAVDKEQERLERDMESDLARMIMERIAAASSGRKPAQDK